MHYMQTAADWIFIRRSWIFKEDPAEDARVHCVVLKIRTEPCGVNLHPKIHASRPFEKALRSSCFLRTQQRAHPDGGSVRSFGLSRKRAAYWPRLHAPTWMNNQCSTRKHGRRSRHSLLSGAGAP